ncbi:MAG: hypothetical protein U0176_20455 [Bacteroidia bacterium]
MSNFDNLPEARPRQKSTRTNAPAAAKPSRPAYEFQRPEDTPSGAAYRKTANGFIASAPAGTWLMGLLTSLITFGLGAMIWNTKSGWDVPMSFFIVVGGLTVIFFVLALYFIIGRVKVSVNGDRLTISKTVLGVGLPRNFRLSKIQRMRIKSRSGQRALGWFAASEVKDQVCEIETDREIRIFGAHLRAEHLYYLRYLVIQAARAHTGKEI